MTKKITSAVMALIMSVAIAGCSAGNTKQFNAQSTMNPSTKVEGNISEVMLNPGDKYAVITVKDYGEMKFKLYPDAAPKGVANFEKLVNDGFYTNQSFHRIVENFMAQGGQPQSEEKYEQFAIETNYSMRHFYGALSYANAMGSNSTQFFIVNRKDAQDASKINKSVLENYVSMFKSTADSVEDKESMQYKYYRTQEIYYKNMIDFIDNLSDDAKKKYKEVGGTLDLDGNYTVFGMIIEGTDVLDKISAVETKTNSQTQEKSEPVTPVIIEKIEIKTA